LPDVTDILRQRYGFQVRFHVTFTAEEWSAKSSHFREVVANAGPLAVAQCPTFYRMMDGVIFPSLLECFSVTPLEALVMEKPLFASARSFVTELCGNYGHYFDPLDPGSIAAVIADYYRDGRDQPETDRLRLQAGRAHALAFSNPQARAQQYLAAIEAVAAR
jgi:glycosyltransferase involved in cell wall biosynthesis